MVGKPVPEADKLGKKTGLQLPNGRPERFRRVVFRKLAPAREHVHPDVPVEDDPLPPRGGEDGGRGGRTGEPPGCCETVFHGFPPGIDGNAHAADGPFLFKLGKGGRRERFFQPVQCPEEMLQRGRARYKKG